MGNCIELEQVEPVLNYIELEQVEPILNYIELELDRVHTKLYSRIRAGYSP